MGYPEDEVTIAMQRCGMCILLLLVEIVKDFDLLIFVINRTLYFGLKFETGLFVFC